MANNVIAGQTSIFDWQEPVQRQIEPEFKAGDRIYKLILDVVETGIIDRVWELEDGKRHGYSAKKESGTYITFWTENIGDTVFSSKKEVYNKADSLKNTYKVIRASSLEVVEERNFIEICTDSRTCITATAKLLKGNTVYIKGWFCYPFLEFFKSEDEAEKRYREALKKINDRMKLNESKMFEVKPIVEIKDMYLARTGKWSSYDYVNFNNPVLV